MKLTVLAVACLALLVSSDLSTPDADYTEVAAKTVKLWKAWAAGPHEAGKLEKRYTPSASKDGRVVVVTPSGTSASKLLRSAKKAVAIFDKLFLPESREPSAPSPRSAVLFPIAGPQSFESITAAVAKQNPSLSGWANAATRGVGFLLEDPLAGGWLLKVPTSEVWNVENELVNRLARLLIIERYGRQPHWLSQGLAWHVEIRVCKDVYCFPYRNGFVPKKEHRSWAKRLPLVMTARGETPLEMDELCGWSRNSWHADSAALASGAVEMLVKHYPNELPAVLKAFAELRGKDGRNTADDGSWTVIPDYEIPSEQQQEILNRELNVDFLAEFDRYARAPKRYRRPR